MTEPNAQSGSPDPAADAAAEPVDSQFEQELEDDAWLAEDAAGPSLVTRMLAETAGTFILVFLGLGAALFFATGNNGTLTIAFSFAIGVVIAALVFGGVSGAHINPAVTVAMWLSGRFPGRDVVSYIIAQIVGGIAAGAVLVAISSSHPEIVSGREFMNSAANGYGENSPVGFGLVAGLVVEVILAALLVAVVLAVTSVYSRAGAAAAPFAIGLTFGLLVMFAIPFTNGALNPARSTGAALFADAWALQQLWVFWVAPLVGAAIAGLLFRAFGPEEDLIIVETVEEIHVIED
ncbi:MIP family channel protein [Demequina sp. SO4-18]|uniref:MIP family channel protein n=1 Tax=Demequina sp. SO4-18 TaxID=3401026 RepID=UPI003B59CF64